MATVPKKIIVTRNGKTFQQTFHVKTGEDVKQSMQKQTDTKEFKAWFKGSKVVDEKGEPLVVYHGTKKVTDFSKFDIVYGGDYGAGAYFTNDPEFSGVYAGKNGVVYATYLSIKNPLVVKDRTEMNDYWDGFMNYKEIHKKPDSYGFRDHLKAAGYDGVIATHPDSSRRDSKMKFYVVLEPNQVKSATGNNGKFNPKSNDITKAVMNKEGKVKKIVIGKDGKKHGVWVNATEKVKNWKKKQHEEYDVHEEKAKGMAEYMKRKGKGIVKAVKHEIHEWKEGAEGLKTFFQGDMPTKSQAKAIKTIAVHAAIVAAMTVGQDMAMQAMATKFALGYLEHAGLMRVAHALTFAKGEMTHDQAMERMVEDMAKYIEEQMKKG